MGLYFTSVQLKNAINAKMCCSSLCSNHQEMEKERTDLLEDVTYNKRKMKELEDNLLYRLTSTQVSKGNSGLYKFGKNMIMENQR